LTLCGTGTVRPLNLLFDLHRTTEEVDVPDLEASADLWTSAEVMRSDLVVGPPLPVT
jgi:hypothetical protein